MIIEDIQNNDYKNYRATHIYTVKNRTLNIKMIYLILYCLDIKFDFLRYIMKLVNQFSEYIFKIHQGLID